MLRVDNEAAFIIHRRPFRETSFIIYCLTAQHGMVHGVVKGARSVTKTAQKRKALLQPFVPLQLSWGGRSDLKTIYQIEGEGRHYTLQGSALYSAFYLNELIYRLLSKQEPSNEVFSVYCEALTKINVGYELESVLRQFELTLLQLLGYEIHFACDGEPLQNHLTYGWSADDGFFNSNATGCWLGRDLVPIQHYTFEAKATRLAAKQITRQAINTLLGGDVIQSRDFFR